jgi:hypothetical protein
LRARFPGRNLEIFNGWGVEGDACVFGVRALDRLKNRYTHPSTERFDSRITLAEILAPGNDISRWKVNEGAEIVGYVSEVKPDSIESTNCCARDDLNRDTHIEMVLDPMEGDASGRMIVEVTPHWRFLMSERGMDWSTQALRDRFLGHWVKGSWVDVVGRRAPARLRKHSAGQGGGLESYSLRDSSSHIH